MTNVTSDSWEAHRLLDRIDDEPGDQGNRFVELAESGRLERGHVSRFLTAEHGAQQSEIVAFATLAARHPHPPAAGFFLGLAGVIGDAGPRLRAAAGSVDLALDHPGGDDPGRLALDAPAHAFGGYVCWLALRAGQAGAALAIHADLVSWCGSCARITAALEKHGGLPDEVVAYFAAYAQRPEHLLETALEVASDGLRRGEDPDRAVAEARPVTGYLRLFWDSAAAL